MIVIAILAGGFLYVRNVDQQDKQRMRDLYAEVEPLQRQREALIAERDRLETEYTLQMRDVGTVELLFRQLNVSIFTDVYPQMRDRGIVGVEESPDLRIILPDEKITKIIFSYRERFEPVTDTKTLYYIVKGKIPARLRPSENGAGIIIQKSELRFAADS